MMMTALVVFCALAVADQRETQGSPNAFHPTPAAWPVVTNLPRAEAKPTVLMFVRADDATGTAKIAELGKIVSDARTAPFVAIVQVGTEVPTALWDAAGRIPRTARLLDKAGVEARRFGAVSTGQVVVYAADGTLRYTGAPTEQLRLALR